MKITVVELEANAGRMPWLNVVSDVAWAKRATRRERAKKEMGKRIIMKGGVLNCGASGDTARPCGTLLARLHDSKTEKRKVGL
jgi:hypothetical protein